MTSTLPLPREQHLNHLRAHPKLSVLIIGAGVNGIGTFRDLALQGVDVAIVDRGDFCSGASAASSHMVHGGIRYLENGEFRLVREAVQERNRLIQNAPHYVRPLPTVIPIFKWLSGALNAPLKFFGLLDRPAERGGLVIKLGLMLYDAFTLRQGTVPRHRYELRKRSLARFPALNPQVRATATYYDGTMPSPERICIDLLVDAAAANPEARAMNYVSAVGASGDTVTLQDEVSGKRFDLQPRVVVNAAGPWIDFTNQALGRETVFIGGTKGSHLVLDHPELRAAIGENEFFFENKDGRIVLIFPLGDKVLVGTSDLPIEDPDSARCTEAEIDYFLGMIPVVFPGIAVDRSQIVFQFSGVRPLPASDAKTTGQISRDHHIRHTPPGNGIEFPIYSLVGGKWTSFRAFSEQTADVVLQALEEPRVLNTRDLAIGGGREYPQTAKERETWIWGVSQRTRIPQERVETLFERYGTRAEAIATYCAAGADTPLQNHSGYTRREIRYLVENEMSIRLDDLLLRRTLLGMLGELSPGLVAEFAEVLGEVLRWSQEAREEELRNAHLLLAERHGVKLT